jgi:Fe2+ transport system protein FeoA
MKRSDRLNNASVEKYGYPLVLAEKGETVMVVSLDSDSRSESRLVSMGINPGAVLRVLSAGGGGPIIVARGETRLGINRKTAWHVRVVPESGENGSPVLECSGKCWGCSYRKGSFGNEDFTRTTLEQLRSGQEAKVLNIRKGRRALRRLNGKGIHVGTRLKMIECPGHGRLVVDVADGRVVRIGYGEAMHIEVEVTG